MVAILTRFAYWTPLAFALVTIWQFQHAGVHMDTARDWAQALSIVNGEQTSRFGPDIGRLFHLSPLWFYVLAVPLWLGGGFEHVAWWVAALFATQFWWAYALGERMQKGAGMLACAALTMPNWTIVHMAGTTHTLLVVPCVLATLLAHWRFVETPSAQRALILGASAAFALHAHPTTMMLVFSSVWALARTFWRVRSPIRSAAMVVTAFLVGLLVWFVPTVLSANERALADVGSKAFGHVKVAPQVLWGAFAGAVDAQWHFVGDAVALKTASGLLWAGGLIAAMVGGAQLFKRPATTLQIPLGLIGLLGLGTLLVAASRGFVTFYMVGAIVAFAALLMAWGWTGLSRVAQSVVAMIALALHVAWASASVSAIHHAGFKLNVARALDIAAPSGYAPWALQPTFPATTIQGLAAWLCANSGAHLHGVAVPGIDLVADVLMQRACPAKPRPMLGGSETNGTHVISTLCADQPSVDGTGTVCWHRNARVRQSSAIEVASRMAHPPRLRVLSPERDVQFAAALAPGETLIATHHRMEWASVRDWRVTHSPQIVSVARAPWWRSYTCDAKAEAGCWVNGIVRTSDAHAFDVSIITSVTMNTSKTP